MNWSQVWAFIVNNQDSIKTALWILGGTGTAGVFIKTKAWPWLDNRLRERYAPKAEPQPQPELEPETIHDDGFLPDRRKPQWEVHASEYFNQPVTVLGIPDGTGWSFRIPVYVRNMGIRLTPAFNLDVHAHSPYVLREIRDWNAIMLGEWQTSELSDKNLSWRKVTFRHLSPLSATPEYLGDIILTIHGVRVPPVMKLQWRVVLPGKRYYPVDSYGWFSVNLAAQPLRIPDLPEQPPMPGETLETGSDQ